MDNPCATHRMALLFVAAAALALAAPALAEGWQPGESGRWVPGTPYTASQNVSDWSGFYIGGKLGGVWSDIGWSEDFAEFASPGGTSKFSPSGFAGGVMGGGNLQMGNWVFGLEAAYVGVGLDATTVSPTAPTDSFSVQLDWLLMVEPRLGYSWDRYMVFVKGGWAGGDAKLSAVGAGNVPGSTATAQANDFVDGWTIGGGIEYAWLPGFIVGVEYQHITLDLGTAASCDLCLIGIPIGEPAAIHGSAEISSVMARASYLFGPED
jgi:outer membrane immunogenic protein